MGILECVQEFSKQDKVKKYKCIESKKEYKIVYKV